MFLNSLFKIIYMSEPAPWGQWDTFSEVQGNSASLSFNESPTVVNVDAQPQTRSVVSDFSSSNSSGSGCTSCQQNTYQYCMQLKRDHYTNNKLYFITFSSWILYMEFSTHVRTIMTGQRSQIKRFILRRDDYTEWFKD